MSISSHSGYDIDFQEAVKIAIGQMFERGEIQVEVEKDYADLYYREWPELTLRVKIDNNVVYTHTTCLR